MTVPGHRDLAAGEKEFQAELANHPEDLQAQYHLAFVWLKRENRGPAIELLHQVVRKKPDYAEAHYSLGKALLEQGSISPAVGHLEKAAELKPEIKRFKGWTSTRGATSHAQLPAEAQAYLDALAEAIETPIAYLSTGPDRVEGCVYPGTFLAELIN